MPNINHLGKKTKKKTFLQRQALNQNEPKSTRVGYLPLNQLTTSHVSLINVVLLAGSKMERKKTRKRNVVCSDALFIHQLSLT